MKSKMKIGLGIMIIGLGFLSHFSNNDDMNTASRNITAHPPVMILLFNLKEFLEYPFSRFNSGFFLYISNPQQRFNDLIPRIHFHGLSGFINQFLSVKW
ncbi:hypothetical protein SFC27_03480 [Bacillus licheniformis]|uniref:Uncharacterized protein n=2 Tax=Bacillus licheniformis TaxID=1402 RepID=A0AB37GMQ0_BACLI|nr:MULTISPECIES: hypothetical protein [Bacillus]MBY8346816.1 hypothetical protein [Bacillus sp. PCH94]AKQ73404.1 hypothetical protein MUY_002272 [Bacillus licheniformis WX-02]AMR10605.1 hypothetical protein AB684_10575 [Bacillus licheniformis]APJ27271.1 hypothetical protein BSZ43_10965 [Bacillus sp. H15-1]ARC59095.1 hypothetical protein BaDB11_00427 [Bacillus licheniformis]